MMQETVLKSEYVNSQDGITSGVAYDTAWAAGITDQRGKALFPECVKWLLENQKCDGSWGTQVLNYHDRVLSTLSALIALKEIGRRQYAPYIKKGETYIWETLKNLNLDKKRLIGSELLIPSLMNQAESAGLDLPYYVKIYQNEYKKKLKRIDESLWYSPLATLSFSLEFLGDAVNTERLPHVQLPNGSVATSPAATAFFLRHIKDPKAFTYLKKVLSLTGDGSLMTVYPIEVFEYGWTMYNLMLAGLHLEWQHEVDFLLNYAESSGFGWTVESPLRDADETAVVYKILRDYGYPVDLRAMEAYGAEDYFVTYRSELDSSVSTNVHVLDFVQNCPEFPDKESVIEKLVRFLRREMHPHGFWIDKWHVSPYYPTSHAVIALCDADPSLAEKAVSWILETQNEHGLWGENNGTLEETAYAVQALMYYHNHVEHIDRIVSEAVSTVFESFTPFTKLPDLWIGKVLYAPIRVVWSSVASAHFMVRSEDVATPLHKRW